MNTNNENNQANESSTISSDTTPVVAVSAMRKGRPEINIEFPQGNFEIKDLVSKYNTVSRVTLQLRVNEALDNGTLTIVSTRQPQRGRPAKIFKVA